MPAINVVYVRATVGVDDSQGNAIRMIEGDVWDADDPFVKERPDLFSDKPTLTRRSQPLVEQATAAPGEVRGIRRGR